MADTSEMSAPPTIYDVARVAGVSIASVSRVLNGHRNPRAETSERVLQAVAELGFVPDGAARALSARLKEVVGVVVRRPLGAAQRRHVRRRGREPAVPRHDQPGHGDRGPAPRLRPADQLGRPRRPRRRRPAPRAGPQERRADPARPACSTPTSSTQLSRQVPVVTLAGVADPDHGQRARRQRGRACARWPGTCSPTTATARLGYLAGLRRQPGQPGPRRDARGRGRGGRRRAADRRPQWQGNY